MLLKALFNFYEPFCIKIFPKMRGRKKKVKRTFFSYGIMFKEIYLLFSFHFHFHSL